MKKLLFNSTVSLSLILSSYALGSVSMADSLEDNIYVGMGVSPSGDNETAAVGWKKYHRDSDMAPAFELEYENVKLKQYNGTYVRNNMANVNVYGSINFTTNPRQTDDKAYDFGVYAMLGGGVGNYANDLGVALGVSWSDIVYLGVKHTRFVRRSLGIKDTSNTAFTLKVTMPLFPLLTLLDN